MKYLTWVWSGSSRDRFLEFIGIYLSLSIPGRGFLACAPLYRGCSSLIQPEYARITLAATAPSVLGPLLHCMSCLLSLYRLLILYPITANVITGVSNADSHMLHEAERLYYRA